MILERFPIGRNQRRHCEERSDEAIQNGAAALPNEIRILDDAGKVAAKWSLADEFERRQSNK
jgi:hypothetical protein